MAEVNTEAVTYIRSGQETPIAVSPILLSADELGPGDGSMTRVEYQDFAIDRSELGPLYPPKVGDQIRRLTGELFILTSMGTSEPPYVHTTSARDRVIVHTVRRKAES